MSITKTLNPIHFEDLDPHRFEDLVRQLFYDFRDWKSIEATGKLGSDDGIDILAIESVVSNQEEEVESITFEERTWIIQCKREKGIGPTKVKHIIKNDITQQSEPPYGYILAADSNFSKKARDAFKLKLNELGVKEFYIFGKAELEDLLFLPKYDHLLFAYFGISLQKRTRMVKSKLQSHYAIKKKIASHINNLENIKRFQICLVNEKGNEVSVETKHRFKRFDFDSFTFEGIVLEYESQYAYVDWKSQQWDVLDDYSEYILDQSCDLETHNEFHRNKEEVLNQWRNISDNNQAQLIKYVLIRYEDIVLFDDVADKRLVEIFCPKIWVRTKDKFPYGKVSLKITQHSNMFNSIEPISKKRVSIFQQNM